MKALYRSTWFRFVLLLMLAAFMAAGAAVPVGADISIDFEGFNYIAKDSYGNIFISDSSLRIGTAQYSDESVYILIGNQTTNAYSSLIFLSPYYYDSNGIIQYKLYQLPKNQAQTSLRTFEVNDKVIETKTITYANLKVYNSTSQVYPTIYNIALSNKFKTTNANIADTYKITCNYPLVNSYNGIIQSSLNNDQITLDDNFNLEKALGEQQLSSSDILNAIDLALQNNDNIINITEKLSILIDYGSNYNQIDQTTINNLGTAQDNLSSAEGALQDKSQSLRDGVSSQWQSNINTTKNFVSTITPATTAITSTITQVVAVMPEEVQALLIVIPLLLFIGWLIGRIEGG